MYSLKFLDVYDFIYCQMISTPMPSGVIFYYLFLSLFYNKSMDLTI